MSASRLCVGDDWDDWNTCRMEACRLGWRRSRQVTLNTGSSSLDDGEEEGEEEEEEEENGSRVI